jgi:hypothetical protein
MSAESCPSEMQRATKRGYFAPFPMCDSPFRTRTFGWKNARHDRKRLQTRLHFVLPGAAAGSPYGGLVCASGLAAGNPSAKGPQNQKFKYIKFHSVNMAIVGILPGTA